MKLIVRNHGTTVTIEAEDEMGVKMILAARESRKEAAETLSNLAAGFLMAKAKL